MKSTLTLILVMCFTLLLQAQVSKTVDLAAAGSLNTLLTQEELTTITDLTVTGTIDARDFKTMRDVMPKLTAVDMSMATIAAYKGPDGPSADTNDYAANAIPQDAFYFDFTVEVPLQTILIPLSTIVIGKGAFRDCTYLTSCPIPSSVTAIHDLAFSMCLNLTSISIPESVTSIGKGAFEWCIGLTSFIIPSSIDSIQSSTFSSCRGLDQMDIPSSVTYIGDQAFYCCFGLRSIKFSPNITTIGKQAFSSCISLTGPVLLPQGLTAISTGTFSNCSSLSSVIIPSSVDSIGDAAFSFCEVLSTLNIPPALVSIGAYALSRCSLLTGPLSLPPTLKTIGRNAFETCNGLTSLILPSSIYLIEQEAFVGCTNITSIKVNHLYPLPLNTSPSVFYGIDKSTTTLYIPFGTKERYSNAVGWKDFANMVEDTNGFQLNSTALNFDIDGGSNQSIEVYADFAWTATADQPWITVTPSSGDSSQFLTITADANRVIGHSRIGTITLRAADVTIQTIHISQESSPLIMSITPGSLSKVLTSEEKVTTTNLTLRGSMDARDFKTIHDEIPNLVTLDIREVTIEAFTYYYSTYYSSETHIFPANRIPYAFSWNEDHLTDYALAGHNKLTIIKLPVSLTAIGYMAFNYCTHLSSIELPPSVTTIESLTFYNCTALASVILPSNFTYIGTEAFFDCINLKSIHCYAVNPPKWNTNNDMIPIYEYLDTTSLIINVPYGTKERYKNAREWGYFKNIIEMPGFMLSNDSTNVEAKNGSSASIGLSANIAWVATSDQTWLTVSPISGNGDKSLTFTADANTTDTVRTAIVTITAPEIDPQTIVITQNAFTTAVAEIDQMKLFLNYYPNPFTDELSIEVSNPLHKEVSVEIYNMRGQRVKTLTKALNEAKISLVWNGDDENGKQLPEGMYLLKVNGEVKKVVKR